VACGECVQACPTGALMEANLLDEAGTRREFPDRHVDTLCPYCGVGCQTRVHVKDDKILYPVRQRSLRFRLHHPPASPDEADDPPR
jgi:predicted molibdopterin-dependent oxidoreductase YjgC